MCCSEIEHSICEEWKRVRKEGAEMLFLGVSACASVCEEAAVEEACKGACELCVSVHRLVQKRIHVRRCFVSQQSVGHGCPWLLSDDAWEMYVCIQ